MQESRVHQPKQSSAHPRIAQPLHFSGVVDWWWWWWWCVVVVVVVEAAVVMVKKVASVAVFCCRAVGVAAVRPARDGVCDGEVCPGLLQAAVANLLY